MPASIAEVAEYPAVKEKMQLRPITHDDRIDYFANYSSNQLGRLKKLYLQWARYKGPLSSQCQELNRLFSQCVDANRVKIPDHLAKLPDEVEPPPFILEVLHEAGRTRIQEVASPVTSGDFITAETLQSILCESSSMSQYELAKLTLRWCQATKARFADFWLYFDPRMLTSTERAWLLDQLPASAYSPSLVMNDLLHSDIVGPSELQKFGLEHPGVRWRLVFNSESERLANLMSAVDRTFQYFTRKLLILHFHERLSVALYVPCAIEPGDECAVGDRVRVFSFPHGQQQDKSHRDVALTKSTSRLYYDANGLQLYERQRANTFIFLTRPPADDSSYRSIKGQGHQLRARELTMNGTPNYEWRTSIALNKFSKRLVTHVGRLHREGVSTAVCCTPRPLVRV